MDQYHYRVDYVGFLNWLELKHPDILRKYKANILPPVDNKGLQVSQKGIDKSTYNMLYELQNDYYIATM